MNWLEALPEGLLKPPRFAIVGGPNTGKTTAAKALAVEYDVRLRHTDDVIDLGWSEASAEVADWLDYPGGLIVEGVAVPRGLRKWLKAHPEGKPVDVVVVLTQAFVVPTDGQSRMAKGVHTVLEEITDDLCRRGTSIIDVEAGTKTYAPFLPGHIHEFAYPITEPLSPYTED